MKNTNGSFENNVNYKKIFQKLLSYKKIYFICIVIFLIGAFVLNKFAIPKYKNYSIIRINENSSSLLNSSNDFMQGLRLFESNNNIEDEIEIISSFTLVKKVINKLDLKASYFTFKNSAINNFFFNTPVCNKKELYKNSPVKVVIDPSVPQAIYLNFKINILNENEFLLETTGTDIYLYNYIDDELVSFIPDIYYKNRYEFGSEIKTQYFNFRVIKTDYFSSDYTKENNLYFYFNNINWLTSEYQQNLSSEPTSQLSTLLKVTLKGTNKERITDFLNVLMSSYMERNLENKNRIALSTVDFIDSQISEIADSLSFAETRLRNFRSSHNVMDLSFQGQQIFEKLNELETEKAALKQQRRYYSYLKNYLDNSTDISDLLAPSSMNVVDPILTNLITQLITLNSERARLVKNVTNTQNLYLADVNLKIDNIIKTIKENVNNTVNTLNISLNEINYRISSLSTQISQMPKTELQLKGIERKFKLNDAIYTFLLQKRSEAQIARASSMPDYEIIDPARISVIGLVSPRKKLNYILALFIGLLLPTSVIMLRDFLNNKIIDVEEIESMTRFPILGKVFHSYRRTSMVVNDYPNSSVTESFRAIRTNFEFFSDGGRKQVLLVTSATSGEGKTFCSINLASVFALNGYKTVLLEFDLRRPKIHTEFDSSNMIGINSYLIEKAIIEDIIMPTHIENLDLISAGPAAPNPAELISSEKTGEFIDKLKEMYDYIIIDSAPAGIVAETFILMKHSDINIFVAKINKTIKEAFANALKACENNKLSNVSVLINDINLKRESYKYGYDNKYYTDDRKGILARLFNNKRKAS
jgi:tyrosine-protein kinase Etk/Wzc